EGRPTRVMKKPLTPPPAIPISSTSAMASSPETPFWTSQPKAQAARPIIDPTDRSISALTMISVIASATTTFSIESWNRLIWLATVRYCGDSAVLIAMVATSATSRKPSQLLRRSSTAFICCPFRCFRLVLFPAHPQGDEAAHQHRVGGDRDEDQRPQHRLAPAFADHRPAHEAGFDEIDEHGADEGADHRSRAAEDVDPAHDRRRDRFQFEPESGDHCDVAEPGEEHEAGEPGEQPAQDEGEKDGQF